MKVLLVADTYYPKVDGTLRFMEEFLNRSKDLEVKLLVPQLGTKKNKDAIFIKPSKWFSLSGYPNMALRPSNFSKIKNSIKESDIIFIQGPALISYLSMYYGKKLKKRTVTYVHVVSWELVEKFFPPIINKLFFQLIKRLSIYFYNKCDEIMVPYRQLKEQLESEGVKTEITVARLGVDIERFKPANRLDAKKRLNLDPHKKIIGFVGRISREKNTDVLLDAFNKLPHQQHLSLLMVGDGPADQTKFCKSLNNCKITGFVNNVEDYLQAMDVFVMPSLTETTSLATLEAMSCGLPVIVTKVGFIQQYVVKDHNGIFFPKNNAATLALKIEKLLQNEELRRTLGNNARRTMAYAFSWERAINKIKKILLK
jgi:phosphatidylinositol alpha 1,6-mannosyltransferase